MFASSESSWLKNLIHAIMNTGIRQFTNSSKDFFLAAKSIKSLSSPLIRCILCVSVGEREAKFYWVGGTVVCVQSRAPVYQRLR